MVGDLIGVKTKLTVEWSMLSDGQFNAVMGAGYFVDVEYGAPDGRKRAEMFVSPRGGSLAYEENGVKCWQGIKLVLTER
jgi:hypothetical protein